VPKFLVQRWSADDCRTVEDFVADEEPLAIEVRYGRIDDRKRTPATTTMRTPGHDADLAVGWLFTERHIRIAADAIGIVQVEANLIRVDLHPDVEIQPDRFARAGYASSACGLCGKTLLDRWDDDLPKLAPAPTVTAAFVSALPAKLATRQTLFRDTGGVHAAASFSADGELRAVREDVGRHNALDKLLGAALGNDDLAGPIVLTTARAGFELVQKCAVAGIPVLIAVGAPTSLAVETARRVGLTLIGFLRGHRFNVYSGRSI